MNKELSLAFATMLEGLKSSKDAVHFMEPVDVVQLNLVDYHDIIEYPMDLSTVQKKLKEGKYTTLEVALCDVQ